MAGDGSIAGNGDLAISKGRDKVGGEDLGFSGRGEELILFIIEVEDVEGIDFQALQEIKDEAAEVETLA